MAMPSDEVQGSAAPETVSVLLYRVDRQMCGLLLSDVERVVRAVAVTPLPDAPDGIMGIINAQGSILPVVSTRLRLGLPQRNLAPADRFIVARTARRAVALVADSVEGVVERPKGEIVSGEEIAPGLANAKRVLNLEGGLILIHNLDSFLLPEEEGELDDALSGV